MYTSIHASNVYSHYIKMPLSINILGREIPMYGLLCIIGITVSIVFAYFLAKRKKIDFFDFILVSIFALIGAWIGAKTLFIIISFNDVASIFNNYSFDIAFKAIMSGGYVFYGGLIGGAISLLITLKILKLNYANITSIFAVVLPLGHAFGRIGCFISGCCYGVNHEGPFSYIYTQAMDANTPLNTPLLPIQIIESALLFLLFLIILIIYLKSKNSNLAIIIYVFSYPLLRFILEYFRGDFARGSFGGLSTSQWISLLLIISSILFLTIKYFYRKKQKN